jgi:uncharacterized membrane protein YccC
VSRTCTICGHGQRHDIEVALIRRDSYRAIARRFSVSKDALGRHAREHLPEALVRAQEAKEAVRADDLLSQIRELQARALAILEEAHDSGEHRTALAAIGQARANLELQAKLLQLIKEGSTINVQVSPEWVELRAVIISTLEPYEAARSAVVRALEGAGDGPST